MLARVWREENAHVLLPFGGKVNRHIYYGEGYRESLKKLKVELSYDPEIPLLGIYPERTIIQKHTCTSMLMALL